MKGFGAQFNDQFIPLSFFLSEDSTQGVLDQPTASPHTKDPSHVKVDGKTFFEAARCGNAEVVSTFLLGGMDVNTVDMETGKTALHLASAGGHLLVVKVLLDDGAHVNATSPSDGTTPLIEACKNDAGPDICLELIKVGADIDAKDAMGNPALAYAASNHMLLNALLRDPTDLALRYESLADIRDTSGRTLLHWAAQSEESSSPFAIYLLCEQGGMSPSVRDTAEGSYSTPLQYALYNPNVEVIKALLFHGADPVEDMKGLQQNTELITNGEHHRPPVQQTFLDSFTRSPSQSNTLLGDDEEFFFERSLKLPGHAVTSKQRRKLLRRRWDNFSNIRWTLLFCLLPSLLLYFPMSHSYVSGGLFIFGMYIAMGLIAGHSMNAKGRHLGVAAFFLGGLTLVNIIVLTELCPRYVAVIYPSSSLPPSIWSSSLVILWVFTISTMTFCYLSAIQADPGVVQSTPEARQLLLDAALEGGEFQVRSAGFESVSMVRKPLRAKFCKKTGGTVKRFDHYCVWTGNAIGSGNHRFFIVYVLSQFIATIIHFYMGYVLMRASAPGANLLTSFWAWAGNPANYRVVSFTLFINPVPFLFAMLLLLGQIWYLTRNVTCNEVWFAERYTWMLKLGEQAYSVFDQGFFRNVLGFLWLDDLGLELYELPLLNAYMRKKVRKHANQFQERPQGNRDLPTTGSAMVAGGNEHRPAEVHVEKREHVPPNLLETANQTPICSSQQRDESLGDDSLLGNRPITSTSSISNTFSASTDTMLPNTHGSSPQTTSTTSSSTQKSIMPMHSTSVRVSPLELHEEIEVVQALLHDMLAGKKPIPPDHLPLDIQQELLDRVQTMHQQFLSLQAHTSLAIQKERQ